jgi:hypothetical protein
MSSRFLTNPFEMTLFMLFHVHSIEFKVLEYHDSMIYMTVGGLVLPTLC